MVYKTQVFLNHEGDLFRTRLTHSLEVAQLARSMARALRLNEDLCEAIALGHDLGHSPFGHAGQDALDECLKAADPSGAGFEHNIQSLRVVDQLEKTYAAHDGLNLSFETREGLLKHCSATYARHLITTDSSGLGRRFLNRTQPSLEAQLCDLADALAYNTHDLDDGLRSGLITPEQLQTLEPYARFESGARQRYEGLDERLLQRQVLRDMLADAVNDVIRTTAQNLDGLAPASADHARDMPKSVMPSAHWQSALLQLQSFLRIHLYQHPQVRATTRQAAQVVQELFALYHCAPSEMPGWRKGRPARLRDIADYVAGMTDRYALQEHRRLTGKQLDWSELLPVG
jgi:dGTPase